MPNRLIFTVGFEDLYFKLANMMARTIRDAGKYTGDLVIFTTQDRSSPWATCINVAKHKDGDLLKTNKEAYFHNHLLPQVDPTLKRYDLPYDYFMIKSLPGSFIDRSKYDMIYYFDSDMLIIGNLDDIFKYDQAGVDHIVSGFHGHTAAMEMHHLTNQVSPEQLERAKKVHACNGGVFGVPKSLYHFFDLYGKLYLENITTTRHDMPALSLAMIQGNYPHFNLKRFGYWLHFWGHAGRKKKMIATYEKKYGPYTE